MAKDVIELLIEDHREVEQIIEEIEGTTDTATRERLSMTLIEEVMRHAVAEEEVFYPAVRSALERGDELIDEGVKEHQQVEQLLTRLETLDPEDDAFDQTITELRSALEHHVQEEETEIFPQFEQRVDQRERTSLASQLEEAKQDSPSSPSEKLGGGAGDGEVVDLTKDELYEKAKKMGVEGRSKMDKDELAKAVQNQR